jgi:hypothetical protein
LHARATVRGGTLATFLQAILSMITAIPRTDADRRVLSADSERLAGDGAVIALGYLRQRRTATSSTPGPGGAALLKGRSCRLWNRVVVVAGFVDVVSFLVEVVAPVGVEVAVGFDGA